MGNNHSSTQVATTTLVVSRTATPAPAAVTSRISSSISPIISTVTVVSTPQSSLLATQIPPSTNAQPELTVFVTLTPAASTVTEPPTTVTESPKTVTTSPTSSTTAASVQAQPAAALNGLEGGRLENGTAAESSSPLTMATATALGATTPSDLATAGIVVSGKKLVGPFAPQDAILGGIPTKNLDLPITVVFLALFIIGAATHFTIHELNGKRGHKFHLSDAVFDFCMVRTVTCVMRIVWVFRPNNNSVVLAALIFENAGVVVLFAVNVVFTQRMIRALNPQLGWHPISNKFVMAILISVPMIIVWNIVNLTVSSFTLNLNSIRLTKDLLLFGSCWTLFLSVFPILFIGFLAPSNPHGKSIENFGLGSFKAKVMIIISASALLVVGAIVRLAAAAQVHPKDAPGPIDSKLVFYLTGFTLEIIVVYLYAISRIDLRFWVPNGSSQPGDYSKAKSGFRLPEDDQEALFQEVDFKMRFSSGSNLPRDVKPQGMWDSDDGTPRSARWRPMSSDRRWQDSAVNRTNATRDQVRQAIWDLKLNSELVGQPVEVGNGEELLVYAFKCRRGSYSDTGGRMSGETATLRESGIKMPRKVLPPRNESWAAQDRDVKQQMSDNVTMI
ncbi:uncharacterized protein PAC_07894 [Phialocephala subalpina]|uniref:Uncharacterized protein n=1 Tax=Phialocephala subalpina TaxID=576137 RepID=A0A1L7WZ15_9HELO|nr:uncharacterized protein PAC_07894 [Phialocephala subalpina]